MDLNFSSQDDSYNSDENDSYNSDENDDFVLGNTPSNGKKGNDKTSHDTGLEISLEEEASDGRDSNYEVTCPNYNVKVQHEDAVTKLQELGVSSEEDWDAECDDNTQGFVLASEECHDPHTDPAYDDHIHDYQHENEMDVMVETKPEKTENTENRGAKQARPTDPPIPLVRKEMSKRDWLREIEDLYFDEKEDLLQKTLESAYDSYHDPYDLVLYFATNAYFDVCCKRSSIAKIALTCFNGWLRSKFFASRTPGRQEKPLLKPCHQQSAMDFIVSKGLNYIDLIVSIYDLKQGDKKILAKKLDRMFLKGDKHKEVATIAGKLGLQKYFESEEIMLPLLVFDKVQVIETFVGDDKEQQSLFLKLLNELCGKDDEELLDFISSKGLTIVDKNKFRTRTLQKISEKYVKKYNLDPVDYPNVFSTKNRQSLHLLLRKKYGERKLLGQESKKWDGLLEGAVVENEMLQAQLVFLLETEYNDRTAAVEWARWLGIPYKELPPKCRHVLETEDKRSNAANPDKSSTERRNLLTNDKQIEDKLFDSHTSSYDEFYQLSLPRNAIYFVDTAENLYKCLTVLFKSGLNIGFDAEWVPTYGRAGTQERIAILQLATNTHIFLIDLITLNETDNGRDAIRELLEELLTSDDNLVIGYGIASDLRILMNNYPYTKGFIENTKRFIDLCTLSQLIFSFDGAKKYFPDTVKGEEKGLSLLVKRCLGKFLDKTYQVSNWEKRPLLEEQILYAALDAYCLLDLYDVLNSLVRKLGLKVNMEPDLNVPGIHQAKEQKKKPSKNKEEVIVTCIVPGAPNGPESLKVVCDTMLQGLGRSLRCCGIDTLMLSNDETHAKALELSHRDNRVILTKGKPFQKLRGYVPKHMIMDVPSLPTKDQIASILKRYNIILTKEDIFSRCQNCNGNNYIRVTSDEMRKAYNIKIGKMLPDIYSKDSVIDYENLTINDGISLRLEYIQRPQLDKVDHFYCCGTCGKIYWEGSHLGRKAEQFKDLLSLKNTDDPLTVYQKIDDKEIGMT